MNCDQRLERALDESNLPYEFVRETGDFLCEVKTAGGGCLPIFISSSTEQFREYEIRGISCAVKILEGPLSLMYAHRLLEHNARMKMTSWSIQVGDGYLGLVLTGRLPATVSGPTLRMFLQEMALIAIEQQRLLDSDQQ